MDITFISIHSLDEDARILYTSDSVVDVLGYTPESIVNHSAWDFFPEGEVPIARDFHRKRISMDKAAVLAYCRVRHQDGRWIGCECCFTVVYDVMVVCTSTYKQGARSQQRALQAPVVRRLFSSSPEDPRYHMLTHISHKFTAPVKQEHEPRAALFVNRFTRTLTIMYATSGLADIVGISAEAMQGRSFYHIIAPNCLPEAIKCLENAKANDSIAYLRFSFRDPRQDDPAPPPEDSDEEMTTDASTDESVDGSEEQDGSSTVHPSSSGSPAVRSSKSLSPDVTMEDRQPDSRTSSDESTNRADAHEAIFDQALAADSSASSVAATPDVAPHIVPGEPIELEAVISCASDGLVVCLRQARPILPTPSHPSAAPLYRNGFYAAPWADRPLVPRAETRAGTSISPAFAPSLSPYGAQAAQRPQSQPQSQQHQPESQPIPTTGHSVRAGPDPTDFMNAIREQAVFAWALGGINGSLGAFMRGVPTEGSVPRSGLRVWSTGASSFASHEKPPQGSPGPHTLLSDHSAPSASATQAPSMMHNTAVPKSPPVVAGSSNEPH